MAKNRNEQEQVNWIISLFNELKQQRHSLEHNWQEVNYYVRPNKSSKDNKHRYDSTAIIAAEFLTSALWSFLSNSAINWFDIEIGNLELNYDVKQSYKLQQINKIVKQTLNQPLSGFYYKVYEFYSDLVCYGTAVFYLEECTANKSITYKMNNLANTYIYSMFDAIDTVIEEISLTAIQAIDLFGSSNVSNNIIQAAKNNNLDIFQFLHVVLPNRYVGDNSCKLKGMHYVSYYIDINHQIIVKKGGYYEFPYMVARWYTNTNDLYGDSPSLSILSEVKMVNAISKTLLVSAQKQVDPPLLAPNEMSVHGIKAIPGGVIYGGIDLITGNQLLKPLNITGNLDHAYVLYNERKKMINEAYYNSVLISAYNLNATATEVNAHNEQKIRLLGSKVARIQSEFLHPLIDKQIKMLLRMGAFADIASDQEIVNYQLKIQFNNMWNIYENDHFIHKVTDITNIITLMNNINPKITDYIDWYELLNVVMQNKGVTNIMLDKLQNQH